MRSAIVLLFVSGLAGTAAGQKDQQSAKVAPQETDRQSIEGVGIQSKDGVSPVAYRLRLGSREQGSSLVVSNALSQAATVRVVALDAERKVLFEVTSTVSAGGGLTLDAGDAHLADAAEVLVKTTRGLQLDLNHPEAGVLRLSGTAAEMLEVVSADRLAELSSEAGAPRRLKATGSRKVAAGSTPGLIYFVSAPAGNRQEKSK